MHISCITSPSQTGRAKPVPTASPGLFFLLSPMVLAGDIALILDCYYYYHLCYHYHYHYYYHHHYCYHDHQLIPFVSPPEAMLVLRLPRITPIAVVIVVAVQSVAHAVRY
jgi:hypothetical protein